MEGGISQDTLPSSIDRERQSSALCGLLRHVRPALIRPTRGPSSTVRPSKAVGMDEEPQLVPHMTIAQRVNQFLSRRAPAAFCDDCIAKELSLSRRQAQRVTSALGMTTFRRAEGSCSVCEEMRKKVIHG